MTLTLRNSRAPLRHQIDSLQGYFRQLRRLPVWTERVTGGVWFLQVTHNDKDASFHPHLHILTTGKYLPQQQLSREWARLTHGSRIVDVRRIRDGNDAAKYVARYVSQPCNLLAMPYAAARHVVSEMDGCRTYGTFGDARKLRLRPPQSAEPGKWLRLCRFSQAFNFRFMDESYAKVWRAWCMDEPLPAGFRVVMDAMLDYASPGTGPPESRQLLLDF